MATMSMEMIMMSREHLMNGLCHETNMTTLRRRGLVFSGIPLSLK